MNKKLEHTYNQISDVFSRAQIKTAVESLDNYKDRLKLIDTIIDRRQEIRQANDLQKITKYAHIFRRMIQRFRNKKEDQAANQRLQLQMVMSLFAPKGNFSPKHQNKNCLTDPHKKRIKEIQDSRRDAIQFKVNRILKQPNSDRRSNQPQNKVDSFKSGNRTHRFLSAINVDDAEQEKELYLWDNDDELYNELQGQKGNNSKFLHIQKDIQSIYSKIQQSKILKTRINLMQSNKDQENFLKQFQKQQLSLQKRQYKPSSQPQLPQNFDGNDKFQLDQAQAQLSQEGSSLLSFENKLQKLYQKSKEMQNKGIKGQVQNQQLINTNKEIIQVSKHKLSSNKH